MCHPSVAALASSQTMSLPSLSSNLVSSQCTKKMEAPKNISVRDWGPQKLRCRLGDPPSSDMLSVILLSSNIVTLLYKLYNIAVSSGSVTINDDSSVQILAEQACTLEQLDPSVSYTCKPLSNSVNLCLLPLRKDFVTPCCYVGHV